MPLYLYQAAYTSESLAAQIKDPQDRFETAGRPAIEAVGGKLLGGGFSFGEYDLAALFEAPNDVAAAAFAVAVAAGGAIRTARTTKLMTGAEWVEVLKQAGTVANVYRPAR